MKSICDNCMNFPCTDDMSVMLKSCPAFYPIPKPQTNADHIRGMTDEELAEWLERIRLCCTTDLCGRSCPLAEICYSNAEEPKETLGWLKQEVE